MRGLKHGTGKEEEVVKADSRSSSSSSSSSSNQNNGKEFELELRTEVYEGEFCLGKRHGTGFLVRGKGTKHKEMYFGEWKEDLRHGVSLDFLCTVMLCSSLACAPLMHSLHPNRVACFVTQTARCLMENGMETANMEKDGSTYRTQDRHFLGFGRKGRGSCQCLWIRVSRGHSFRRKAGKQRYLGCRRRKRMPTEFAAATAMTTAAMVTATRSRFSSTLLQYARLQRGLRQTRSKGAVAETPRVGWCFPQGGQTVRRSPSFRAESSRERDRRPAPCAHKQREEEHWTSATRSDPDDRGKRRRLAHSQGKSQ